MYYKGMLSKSKGFVIEPNKVLGTRNNKNELTLNFDVSDKSEIDLLRSYLLKGSSKYNVTRTDIVNIFNKFIVKDKVPVDDKYENIIFEVYKDDNGSLYGKELHSGIFFPLNSKESVIVDYSVITENETDLEKYVLSVKLSFAPQSMSKSVVVIDDFNLANDEEVKKYLKNFKKSFFNNRKHKSFIEFLTLLSKNNQFNNQAEKKLIKVEKIDEESKEEVKGEIKKEEKKTENSIDFLEYVDDLRYSITSDFLNDNNNLTIEEVDNILGTFLRFMDAYSLNEQEKIFNDLAYIYLILVSQHKEEIIVSSFQDSYFKDMLNAIISNIQELKENLVIDNKNSIDLNRDITVEYVLDLIKQNEIDKEKLKEYEFRLSK